jgi:acyl-CoA dehydrogenase
MNDLYLLISENLHIFNYSILFLAVIFAYNGFSVYSWIVLGFVLILQFDPQSTFWMWYAAIPFIIGFRSLRRHLITRYIVKLIKKLKLLPKISDTERTALRSGNVWVDGQLFSGKPDFKWIFKQKYPKLTKEEQDFLDNETEQLCAMCDDDEVSKTKDLTKEIWAFIKKKQFFGMIIPKKYGGLGFSAYAHSAVIQKLSSRSVPLAITVMVPNSLGPAELLLYYGTKKQQDYYLPRLASGKDIPCFALTEPGAGSDANSIESDGVIFKDKNKIKIKLNWKKRYITLGAVSTVIGLAFKLKDPENILKKGEDLGITCALIKSNIKGVILGRRHNPLSTHFINSPINGEDVIIDIDDIIGGENGVGKGWKMLMECLAAGRGISLPSTSAGGAKLVTRYITAYANIRKQFGLSIGKFEGVEEALVRIISNNYQMEAIRSFTAGAVNAGIKPAVVSAIAKYHSTEMFRKIINDGMDIAGGAGIIKGKRNILANPYFSVPISITVEGANIITRSLIHFGQGSIMCHPYAYKEMEALEKGDLRSFDKAFFAHFGHMLRNKIRSALLSLTRGRLFIPSHRGVVGRYERKLAWASATFAYLADAAMLFFGGNLKRKEKINGRFGDILSYMYIGVAVLKQFQEDGSKKEDELVVRYIMKDLFAKMQLAFDGLFDNLFENKILKILIYPFKIFARINRFDSNPSDKLSHKIAALSLNNDQFREKITAGIYLSKNKNEAMGRLENALKLFRDSGDLIAKLNQNIRSKELPKKPILEILNEAVKKKIITKSEANILKSAQEAINDAIQVDEYSLKDYNKL